MGKLLSSLLFLCCIFSINLSATTLPDSVSARLANTEGVQKLQIWKEWFATYNGTTKHEVYSNALEVFCKDAFEVLPTNDAMIACFDQKMNLALDIATHEQYAFTTIDSLLKQSKLIADSLATIEYDPHELQIKWHIRYAAYLGKVHQEDKQTEQLKTALSLNDKVKDDKLFFTIYYLLGSRNNRGIPFEESEQYMLKAVDKVAQVELTDLELVDFYYRIANTYHYYQKYKKADPYYEKMMEFIDVLAPYTQRHHRLAYWRNLNALGESQKVYQLLQPLYKQKYEKGQEYDRINILELYISVLTSIKKYDKLNAPINEYRKLIWEDEKNLMGEDFLKMSTSIENLEKEARIERLERNQSIAQVRFRNNILLLLLAGLMGIGTLLYILQRKKEKRLQLSLTKDKEQQIMETRNKFFSSITHDIRTPLALMLAPIERAQSKIKDRNVLNDLNVAMRNGRKLMNLFTQILDWNKVEAQALLHNPQIGPLKETFDSFCAKLRAQANEQDILFEEKTALPEGQFRIDYDKLGKIFTHLHSNALKFCDAGSTIQVQTKVNTEATQLQIYYSDNGPGIPFAEQSNIFERYFVGSLGKLKEGTGIGLSLVKELAEIMGGKIELQTNKTQGTGFYITLPLTFVAEEANVLISTNSKSKDETERSLILVIEDEPELLQFLQTSLNERYEVVTASSASVGWSIANSQLPDIIISDWNLPDENGGWVCRKVKSNTATNHIPILVLTANNNDRNQKEAFSSGAFAWMSKPFRLETLLKQIESILDQNIQTKESLQKQLINIEKDELQIEPSQDPFIKQVYEEIASNYNDEQFSVDQLASNLSLHRVQLSRALKKLIGQSPSFMIKDFRLRKAQKMLEESQQSISEIAYAVGFSNANYFATAFKKHFDISPSQIRNK